MPVRTDRKAQEAFSGIRDRRTLIRHLGSSGNPLCVLYQNHAEPDVVLCSTSRKRQGVLLFRPKEFGVDGREIHYANKHCGSKDYPLRHIALYAATSVFITPSYTKQT
ncbi:hypothetical protein HZH66_011039 [Vespula vulgaris]|uniref:Uncharacterized protein n=1 Tax=Vespula vulgaris TaxID=7454 RepID=A0A834JEW0_VESVU|nr:hypothetical protein HZH66_011039 [Vespula vulgaris]